jgi:ribulose-bisphosphate carboxylase large chain
MQKQYISIGNEDVYNGQYALAVFKLDTYGGISLLDAASEVAAESSSGSNIKVGSLTPFSSSLDALVYRVDEEKKLVWIAYPWRIFDRVGNVQNIMTFVAGNVLGMGSLKACKLLDIYFPSQMLVQYDGPSYTLNDMRKYLDIYDRPILGSIIKPKIGLTSSEYAELCYDFWVGGGDFVKNDEPQADQDFCPYEKMVDDIRMAMDKAERETGMRKIHSFNVSAADLDTMIKRAEYVKSVMKPGSYAFLVDGLTAGWSAVQTIRRRYPEVFLHFHRAGHGGFTREENPFGYSVLVLTKMARLAGASGIHTGTAGIGKMSGDADEDITSAWGALRVGSDGHFFKQVWSEIPANDLDMKKIVEEEQALWSGGVRAIIASRKNKDLSEQSSWRTLKPTCPIISGGLNPVLLPKFIEAIGTIDFITTMGGGVHSHPMGTRAGAAAVLQAYEAWSKEIPLEIYGQEHEELKVALEFFNKEGKLHGTGENV